MKRKNRAACAIALGILTGSLLLAGCLEKEKPQNTASEPASNPVSEFASEPASGPASRPASEPASRPASGLVTTVTVQGKLVTGQQDVYTVPNNATVNIQCNMDCTFAVWEQGNVQASEVKITARQWTGLLNFAEQGAQLVVTASVRGQLPVQMVLQTTQPKQVKTAAVNASTWSLDGMTWRRGKSLQHAFPATGPNQISYFGVDIESDDPNCSQASPCSILGMLVEGSVAPGDYPIDPNWLIDATRKPNGIRVNVKVIAGFTEHEQINYRPVSGTVRVTKDAAGTYHYSTIAPITVQRLDDGMPHMPQRMTLVVDNGY